MAPNSVDVLDVSCVVFVFLLELVRCFFCGQQDLFQLVVAVWLVMTCCISAFINSMEKMEFNDQ